MTARRGTATYAFDQAILVAAGRRGARRLRPAPDRAERHQAALRRPGLGQAPRAARGRARGHARGVARGPAGALQPQQPRAARRHARPGDGGGLHAAARQLVGLEEKWTGYIVDWIDWNGTPSIPEGAEDSVYMGQTLPYRTANRYITSTSELLALPGFGRDRYLKLAPYITALPHGTQDQRLHGPRTGARCLHRQERVQRQTRRSCQKNREQAKGCFPTIRRTTRSPSIRRTGSGTGPPQVDRRARRPIPAPESGVPPGGRRARRARRPSSGRPPTTSA